MEPARKKDSWHFSMLVAPECQIRFRRTSKEISPLMGAAVTLYVAFSVLAMMNVITGTFGDTFFNRTVQVDNQLEAMQFDFCPNQFKTQLCVDIDCSALNFSPERLEGIFVENASAFSKEDKDNYVVRHVLSLFKKSHLNENLVQTIFSCRTLLDRSICFWDSMLVWMKAWTSDVAAKER